MHGIAGRDARCDSTREGEIEINDSGSSELHSIENYRIYREPIESKELERTGGVHKATQRPKCALILVALRLGVGVNGHTDNAGQDCLVSAVRPSRMALHRHPKWEHGSSSQPPSGPFCGGAGAIAEGYCQLIINMEARLLVS